jgi:streptomycin 6-kinase
MRHRPRRFRRVDRRRSRRLHESNSLLEPPVSAGDRAARRCAFVLEPQRAVPVRLRLLHKLGPPSTGSALSRAPRTVPRVTSRLRVPAYLQASAAAGGPTWATWMAALPARVEQLCTRWQLVLDEPFEPGGNCSWVAPGTDADGRDVVLKVAWQHTEALHEAEGLAALGGQGAAELYAFDHIADDTTALLLERCRPGTELRERPEAEQHVVVTDLLRSVWAVELPPDHPFRPLSVMADDWVARAEARLDADPSRFDGGLAREGLMLFGELSRSGPAEVLLFTDLHAGNVLSGQRRPWLLIDPKPYVGDPHYDVVQHLLNCNASLRADPIELLSTVADLAGLDARRVRQWLFARCVQESLGDWTPWPDLDLVLRKLSH